MTTQTSLPPGRVSTSTTWGQEACMSRRFHRADDSEDLHVYGGESALFGRSRRDRDKLNDLGCG